MPLLHSFRRIRPDLECCFNIQTSAPLSAEELERLRWIMAETFEPDLLAGESFFDPVGQTVVELGPRMAFATAGSTNRVAICHAAGIGKVNRIEVSRRYVLAPGVDAAQFITENHDRMTEQPYPMPLTTFETGAKPKPVFDVPLIEQGPDALRQVNRKMGLGMDEWDIGFYHQMFAKDIGRNPTIVECFQLGQANSEHSRHWFFKGKIVIDGVVMPRTLLEVVQSTLKANPGNSVIAFKDNSSAIRGYIIWTIVPTSPAQCSRFVRQLLTYHLIFTAETHNFPTGVCSIPGAETGTGGRDRDIEATGRGGLLVAGTCGFAVGNLNIPGYCIPGEDNGRWDHPPSLQSPLQILLGESFGAWDYGNKIGEPVIVGFTRNFGLRLPNGERREWLKPIMFTGGLGQMDACHTEKAKPEKRMLVVQIGGPAYRIGVGGGSASSMIQGANVAELDFSAVQRGDAQMGNKLFRVGRACVEMGERNPIMVIHDQGAGGPCNVLTELVEPAGGRVNIRNITISDVTLSVLEIWSAEYQERNGFLIWWDRLAEFQAICRRERINCEVLGEITGDGRIVVYDSEDDSTPVNLELARILSHMPQKTFEFERIPKHLKPFRVPKGLTVSQAWKMVSALLSVGSKEGLLNRVDRSVTGLIARQQYCGAVQLPVADVGVIAQSHFDLTGGATSIGEQPIKMLVSEKAGARMAVGEMLTNMACALISGLSDIKISANWMWAAKQAGEGALLYDAAVAAEQCLIALGPAIDGGKDSLSMAAKVGDEIVKAPGELVISGYCTMPDITKVVTPDIKYPGRSKLMLIDLSHWANRLGGSALAQAHSQIGKFVPDLSSERLVADAFGAIQHLIRRDLISAIHDVSDGGRITTLLEMAFSGNCGLDLSFRGFTSDPINTLFAEELGWVIEFLPKNYEKIRHILQRSSLGGCYRIIGRTVKGMEADIRIHFNGVLVLSAPMPELRAEWRETSFQLDALQSNPETVTAERKNTYVRPGQRFRLAFRPKLPPIWEGGVKPKVAVIREEGTNGDREMASAFFLAGFEVWDVTMTDLIEGRISLKDFQGIVFPGGFSFADVFGAGKGWAAVIKFNQRVADEFAAFFARSNTFVLGVCNGCQLMALLGLVPGGDISGKNQPRLLQNTSTSFESRFVTVHIDDRNPSIFLTEMGGSNLGIWVAHGEGRLHCPDQSVMDRIIHHGLAPIRYISDYGDYTAMYPLNPNGSPEAIAGLTSEDGRFLAMMPHPERLFLRWQWPYWPKEWKSLEVSPWLRLFQNARAWCDAN